VARRAPRRVGARSFSNVVDATQLRAARARAADARFDLARLGGATFVVRRARDGEALTTLDGQRARSTGSVLVIADAERAQAWRA
jgi:phenylalanyl-tRNA synthetase beta chain